MYSCDSGAVKTMEAKKKAWLFHPIFISFLKCNESGSLRPSFCTNAGEAGHGRHEHQGYQQKTFHRIKDIFWLFEDCL